MSAWGAFSLGALGGWRVSRVVPLMLLCEREA
jgi:hypothetical protein